MYFNKKYRRTGALFAGPYKSVQIKDLARLLLLTHYFHQANNDYSSSEEFNGKRTTSWVKPDVVLNFFEKGKTPFKGGAGAYQNFVENYKLEKKEVEALEEIILESSAERLERKDLPLAKSTLSEQKDENLSLTPLARIPELIAAGAVFLLLFAFGTRNVILSSTAPSPEVWGVEDENPLTFIKIKIGESSTTVPIHKEASLTSEVVGEAKDGDTLEFVSLNSDWYEVKLENGLVGFILAKYIE